MATVSAPVKRVRRLRPAPLWLSLLPAFLAYFLLDFSLRLFYGAMSNVSLWAWQPLVFTLLWSGTMTAIAALLPRTAYLPAGHVRAVCAADDRALRALSADGHVFFLCRSCV